MSLVLTLIYAYGWNKHYDINLTLTFVLMPVTIYGYVIMNSAETLHAALNGKKLTYIGGCYLILFIMLTVFRLCNVKISKAVTTILLTLSTLVYLSVMTEGYLPIFYKSVSLEERGGELYLAWENAFMHSVFYVMMFSYFFASFAVIIYSYKNSNETSNKTIILLFLTEFFPLFAFIGGRAITRNIEFAPLAYLLCQILYLIIVHRIYLYDITDSGIDSIVNTHATGFLSFDLKYNYLGSDDLAKEIIPELNEIKVDTPIDDNIEAFSKVKEWLDAFKENELNDKFHFEKGDKIYLADVNHLFGGNKKKGYQIIISDDTKNQKYIELLDTFNESLQKEVEAKTAHILMMHDNLIMSMATMIEGRDNSTGGHIKRTSDLVRILVNEIKKDDRIRLSDEFCEKLIKAAPMHDLGKIAVDDRILRKPGRYDPSEYEEMKQHAAQGARIVHEILKNTDDSYFHQIAENVAHYHHERWDGSGYPEGLTGDDIPIEARIMAIADVYDALVSKRVYKEKMSFEQADEIILDGMGTQFDIRLKSYYINARPEFEEYYRSIEE
jgi:putative two-component system response regulator